MARFLFVVVPVVSHLWPAVAIGDALAAAGHDVAWCGPESDLRPLLRPGMTIYPTGKRSYREFHEVGMAAVRELWDEYVIPLNRFIRGPVDRAVAEYRPGVVVADQYALAGAMAADQHGTVWATLAAGILELTPPASEPGLADWVRAKVARVRETAGLPADDRTDLLFSPYLVIATTAHALTGTAPLPEHCVLIGAALGPRRTDPSFGWDWWDPGRRHVLVTAGSMSAHLVGGYIARMMAALEPMADRVQVVLNTAADALPEPPPHVLVVPRAPMLELMPRLDAVICQAGQSTVNEALAHGVPMVVAPIRLGELAVAEQVTRAGAGIAVSFAEATPAQLAAAVTAVLDEPGYRAQARRIAGEYAAAGGAGAAAAHLAALAAGRQRSAGLAGPGP
ncbi:MAG TPA: nucleotide disphospho-sugar-binding domain-containing protein [Streptosporangiaceae bacterium]|nr:nucleotide disphospho-sugar-binding domain-containing protein [Streptosporangiaceae bacterium]